MNRYWDALARASDSYAEAEFTFQCPLPRQGVFTQRAGKLQLAFEKKVRYPHLIRRSVNSGIVHILDHSYAFLLAAVPKTVKTIVTVHDLLPLREPDGLSELAIARFRKRVEWVKAADRVLADSIATQNDLIELIGLDPERIRVLPLGADAIWDDAGEKFQVPVTGGFLLSIGGYMKRKNLEILPQVLEQVRGQHPSLSLVRAGGKLPDSLVHEFEMRCGKGALIELGQVSDSHLAALYHAATVTIIPSRYEGFGLPVLEAMARNCPVVCANTTSLPEVGGDAALYFEVDDAHQAAAQILKILANNSEELNALKTICAARAKQFTWEIHFSKLLEIYREVAAIPTSVRL